MDYIIKNPDGIKVKLTNLLSFKTKKETSTEPKSSKIIEDPIKEQFTNQLLKPSTEHTIILVNDSHEKNENSNHKSENETDSLLNNTHENKDIIVHGLICNKNVMLNNLINELNDQSNKLLNDPIRDQDSDLHSETKSGIGIRFGDDGINRKCDSEYKVEIESNEKIVSPSDNDDGQPNQESEDFIHLGMKDRYSHDDLRTKDCGYSWIVLFAMVLSNILTTGYVKGFGILYKGIQDTFPDATGTMSGIMMSLLTGFRSICAPLSGYMIYRFGTRKTMCIGVLIYSGSLCAAYFSHTYWTLAITLAALPGLSQSIIETCQVVLVPQYFESKFSIANGIRVAGNPCGGIIFPLLLTFLLENYGLYNTNLVMMIITLHLFIVAYLMKPFTAHVRKKIQDEVKRQLNANTNKEEKGIMSRIKNLCKKASKHNNNNSDESNQREEKIYQHILTRSQHLLKEREQKKFNRKFLKNPHYIIFVFLAMIIPLGLPLILFNATLYASNVVKLSPYQVTLLLGYQAIFDLVLRLILGQINNKNLYEKSNGFIICLFISGAGTLLIPFATALLPLIGVISVFTFGPASYHCFVNVILTERFGKENIASTYGIVRMTQGIFSFIHPLLIGYILDKTGSFTIPFIIMGCGMIICGVIILAEKCFDPCTISPTEEEDVEED